MLACNLCRKPKYGWNRILLSSLFTVTAEKGHGIDSTWQDGDQKDVPVATRGDIGAPCRGRRIAQVQSIVAQITEKDHVRGHPISSSQGIDCRNEIGEATYIADKVVML